MTLQKLETAITAKIWQAIAQSELDVSGLPKETLNQLVQISVEAALEELDAHLEQPANEGQKSLSEAEAEAAHANLDLHHNEDILWEGRPYLSLTLYYVITNERVIITEGLLGKTYHNIELVRIKEFEFKQSITERAMKLGDIHITSHDSKHPEVILENVKDPKAVHEILRRAVLNAREKYRLSYREEM